MPTRIPDQPGPGWDHTTLDVVERQVLVGYPADLFPPEPWQNAWFWPHRAPLFELPDAFDKDGPILNSLSDLKDTISRFSGWAGKSKREKNLVVTVLLCAPACTLQASMQR